jgi:hypothetical protein
MLRNLEAHSRAVQGSRRSGAGLFADSTVRAVALQRASATGCIGMVCLRRKPLKSAATFASFSGNYARRLVPSRTKSKLMPLLENRCTGNRTVGSNPTLSVLTP